MNLPNKLTVIRVLLVPLLILVYMFPYDTTGINVPVYHILDTDIFDGRIARSKKLITTFGKFADPIADKLLVNTIFLLLASDGKINIIIPIIMISRDTIVDAIKMSAASKQVVVAASKLGKLKTVSQMIALCFLLVNNFPFSVLGIDLATILAWIATVISVISGIDYFIKNREMLMETM